MTDRRTTSDGTTAAEFALGLLTDAELRDAAARARSDPAFAAEVARWRGRLAPFISDIDPVEPPAGLWKQISDQVGPAPANDNMTGLRRRLTMWKVAAGGMTAVAASLALVLALEPRTVVEPAPQAPQLVAVAPMVAMLGDKNSMKVVASWDPAARQLVLAVPGELPLDARHSHELWVIPAGGKPHSLGTIPAAKQSHLELAEALAQLLSQGATIAISVEPRGGSPTGAPTGPVIASGPLHRA